MSTTTSPSARLAPGQAVLALVGAIVAGLALTLLARHAWSSIGLLAVSLALGWVFLRHQFGYTSAIRALLTTGEGGNLAAGLLVPLIAAPAIIPLGALVDGYQAFVWPIGVPLLAGAALFGLGMQLADGCGSGTLYKAGGGSIPLWITLVCFCLGGVAGALVFPAALRLPALPAIGAADLLGPWGGLAATLLITGAMILALLRTGRPAPGKLRAATLIGLLCVAAFLLSGQPWSITMGMTVWGAKALAALGVPLAGTEFWMWDGPRAALRGSLLATDSSLMDIGMLLGAAAAAATAAAARQSARPAFPGARAIAGAVLGGLLMGFGARLSFGCNIGALVGGIASGSLHGVIWLLAATAGSWVGIRLRPRFGLA